MSGGGDAVNIMDMRALKVGQHVTLSDALPGGGTGGVVIKVTKWCVDVQVDRIDGEDAAYYGPYFLVFNYDGNVTMFYNCWWWVSPCPIPDLKILEPTVTDDVPQASNR
jgi:hypothetical protein